MSRCQGRKGFVTGCKSIVCCGALLLVTGCQMWPHPQHDPYHKAAPVTTASSLGAFEQEKTPRAAQRIFSTAALAAADGSVTHGPLYFEDSFGDAIGDDGCFAWRGDDFLGVLTWRARFLLNIGLFPISAFDTPPGMVMRSDGRPSRRVLGIDHDAARVGNRDCSCRSGRHGCCCRSERHDCRCQDETGAS